MRKGTPAQLIAELTDKIDELKGVNSSKVIVDDEEDVIVADEEIETEEVEEIPVEVVEDDHAEYLTGMYASIENELKDLTESVAWDSDEDSIYLDVNFADGHVFSFTIPKADLSYDLQDPDKDIEYICKAVREAGGAEEDYEEKEYEDYSDEEYDNEYEEDLYL